MMQGKGSIKYMTNHEMRDRCRERRSRRLEMRRLSAMLAAGRSSVLRSSSSGEMQNPLSSSSALSGEDTEVIPESHNPSPNPNPNPQSSSPSPNPNPVNDPAPVFGTMSVAGRSRKMEDTITTRTFLCRPVINRNRPVHYFAVYDGHGGAHVSAICRDRMHVMMEEELMRVTVAGVSESGGGGGGGAEEAEEECWRRAMKRCFGRLDEMVLNTCDSESFAHQYCGCDLVDLPMAGSTAVVAVLTPQLIFVANCGDSRAVLCRSRRAIPLSVDHKPDRADERARIEADGGRVVYIDAPRVDGILAMSRSLGDKYLKPVIISEPDISITRRNSEDECLILASDGLWDVVSNQFACDIASDCLRGGGAAVFRDLNFPPQMEDDRAERLYSSRSALAAALLTRLALRRSSDNISVIVVDLRSS